MIKKLKHKNENTARSIYQVFQVSYAVEAKLLKASDFPPLRRTVADFINSNTSFFGFWEEDNLAGIIEIDIKNTVKHIQSLVVDPAFFRRGVGTKLIDFIFVRFKGGVFSVETGIDNSPAINLYKRFGFEEVKQWDTDHGIRKVRFIKE